MVARTVALLVGAGEIVQLTSASLAYTRERRVEPSAVIGLEPWTICHLEDQQAGERSLCSLQHFFAAPVLTCALNNSGDEMAVVHLLWEGMFLLPAMRCIRCKAPSVGHTADPEGSVPCQTCTSTRILLAPSQQGDYTGRLVALSRGTYIGGLAAGRCTLPLLCRSVCMRT